MTDTNILPKTRLTFEWPAGVEETEETRDGFNASVLAELQRVGADLRARGEKPWIEIFYTGFPDRDPDNEDTFDAVQVNEDGSIETLPPYAEILEAAEVES